MKDTLVRLLAKLLWLKLDINTGKDMMVMTTYMLGVPLDVLEISESKKK